MTRTKIQRPGQLGPQTWVTLAQLKQAVNIPVIGNGDIKKAADIDKMLNYTNCDAVMIGRAAIGNPIQPPETRPPSIPLQIDSLTANANAQILPPQ